MTDKKPDMLQRLMSYKDKLDAGGQLTEEEQADLEAIAKHISELITAFLEAVKEAFRPILEALASALSDLWDSFPEPLKVELMAAAAPRLEWSLGDVATPYSAAQSQLFTAPYDAPIQQPYQHFADRLKGDL